MCGGYMKICDNEFLRHEGILAVDPGFSFYNGLGWAYFEDGKLKFCGLIKPFAPGCISEQSILDVLNKFSKQWDELKGFSINPKILCLESPMNFGHHGRKINTKALDDIHFLNGMLTERFKPLGLLRPTPIAWKGNKPKEKHHVEIISSLDTYSKKRLEESLAEIRNGACHNVIDAVGLGLYALPFEKELDGKRNDNMKNLCSVNMR
jgi:hypothetical protein